MAIVGFARDSIRSNLSSARSGRMAMISETRLRGAISWKSRAVLRAARLVAVFMLSACAGRALALDPALDVTQYAHKSWRIRDGFAKVVTSFAQTADGYLWLGTQYGLLRFDGVRNVLWQPPPGASLPDQRVRVLLVSKDGTLWIGTARGLASWREGTLVTYPELNGKFVTGLVEDNEGKIWVGAVTPKGLLCVVEHGRTECFGEDGRFGSPAAVGVYKDSKGVVWAGAEKAVWRWAPGPPVRHAVPGLLPGRKAMSETGDGALLVLTSEGIRQLVDGDVKPFALPNLAREVNPLSLLRDRDGALWIGTASSGLIHLHEGRAETFARSEGLSGDRVFNLFEDREGNVWATTTDGGIDRFRAFATTTYSLAQGLAVPVYSVVADSHGSIWLNTSAGLYRSGADGIRSVLPMRRRSQFSGGGYALSLDRRGRIWMGGESELGTIENDRFVPVRDMPAGVVQAIAQENNGDVWVAHMTAGMLRVSSKGQIDRVPWATPTEAGRGSYWSMSADPVLGGVWIGLYQTVAHFTDGKLRVSHDFSGKLGQARITSLRSGADGTLWIASDAGLMRLKGGRVSILDKASGLPCDEVDSTIEDDQGSLWLYAPCGIASVSAADLATWSRSVDEGRTPQVIRPALLDESDGVRFDATPITGPYGPHIAKSGDGRLWFATYDGVTVVDPGRTFANQLSLPVHVEEVTADHQAYETSSPVRLPPLVRDLRIDYTATTLSTPERTRFRYKLENHDLDWQDAGTRRQAFYNSLGPGDYRFRVIAADRAGAWQSEGATLDFTIAPAYWQTWWFRAFCVFSVLAGSWSLHRRRMRQLARQYSELQRSEEFLAEAQRISHSGSFGWNLAAGTITWSAETFSIFEVPRTTIPTLELVLQRVHPDDLSFVTHQIDRARRGQDFAYSCRLLMGGGRVKYLEVAAHASRDALGDVEFVGAVMDVTERKLTELEKERLGQRLRQVDKMEAIGRLAGGIAHDFNSVLGGIVAFGEMLLEDAPPGSRRRRHAQNVLTAANRGRALVDQILAYSRSQRGKREPISIGQMVTETVELVRGSLPPTVRLSVNVPARDVVVIGDATQLHQVVMNLCSNAIHAMPDGGTLHVALAAEQIDQDCALSHGKLKAGPHARLTVVDSGSGMAAATLSRIFEPFFTTKEVGRGTGLGLSLVDAIVVELGGAIDVASAPGQGSTFAVHLPLAKTSVMAEV